MVRIVWFWLRALRIGRQQGASAATGDATSPPWHSCGRKISPVRGLLRGLLALPVMATSEILLVCFG